MVIKDFRKGQDILEVNINQSEKGSKLSQKKLVEKVLSIHDVSNSKPTNKPMDQNWLQHQMKLRKW